MPLAGVPRPVAQRAASVSLDRTIGLSGTVTVFASLESRVRRDETLPLSRRLDFWTIPFYNPTVNSAQRIAVAVMLVAEAVFLIGWGWRDGSFLYG